MYPRVRTRRCLVPLVDIATKVIATVIEAGLLKGVARLWRGNLASRVIAVLVLTGSMAICLSIIGGHGPWGALSLAAPPLNSLVHRVPAVSVWPIPIFAAALLALALIGFSRLPKLPDAPPEPPSPPENRQPPAQAHVWNALTPDQRGLLGTLWQSESATLDRSDAEILGLDYGHGRLRAILTGLREKGLVLASDSGDWSLTYEGKDLLRAAYEGLQHQAARRSRA